MYNVACGGQAQYLAFAPTALFEGSTNARSAKIHTRDDGRNIQIQSPQISYKQLKFRADGKRQQ